MNIEEIREYCISKPYSTESFPFDDTTLVFKVMDKMFAVIPLEKPELLIVKCDPDLSVSLQEEHESIAPAWHFNKKYWIQINFGHDIPQSLLTHLIDHSYEQVVAKLPKRIRETMKL